MTDTEINIAIAESLGCKDCHAVGGLPCGVYPNEREHRALKKYTASLDACAEFESKLTDEQHMLYREWVYSITNPEEEYPIVTNESREYLSACPLIRCEAYLRTIGAWKESK